MSTQDTAALIESVNNMTETVVGKIAEIDKKVETATAAVPDMLSLKLYVDASSGSDETGTGSSSMPFKTIKKAIESTVANCYAIIELLNGNIDNKHIIANTIRVMSRTVEIRYSRQHIELSETLTTVFTCEQGGCVYFSDYGGGSGFLYSSGLNKTLVSSLGKASLHLGGYAGLQCRTEDETSLTLMRSSYTAGPRGFCEITLSRFSVTTFDGSGPAIASVTVFTPDHAGSAFYNAWQSSLGTNAADSNNSNSVVLVGASKLISV